MLILAPSKVHGVGVVTTTKLAKGTKVELFAKNDYRFIQGPKGEELKLCRRFCVRDKDGYHCPKQWTRMSVGWYLNDAVKPNLEHSNYVYRTRRHVRAGEELTIDYDEL